MATPKLRFKEFDGDLTESKLVELTLWASGGTPAKDIPEYWGDDIPLISGASMHTNQLYESDVKITRLGLQKGSKLAPKDSILILVRGSMLFNKIPMGITLGDVAFNQDVKCIRPKQELAPQFLFQWLHAKENTIQNKVTATGIGAGKLDTADLQNLKLYKPSSEEQTKIASFLSNLDEKISQLTQKHALLSQYKQGMMQKLFSQQIRFKADDGSEFGEWINYKIFNLAKDKTLNNGVFNDQNKVGKGYKLINVLDMYIQRDIDESRLSLLDLDKKEFENNKVNYGDIFFTRSSLVKEGIAFSNVYLGVSDDITYDGNLIKLSPDLNMVEPKFLNYCLKIAYVRKQLIQGGKTATMTTIGQKEVGNTIVKVPCLEEQTKIANFLSSIDQKIEVVAQQIEQARTWKKGLLQQMFV